MILIVNDKVVKQIVKKWPKGVSRCSSFRYGPHWTAGRAVIQILPERQRKPLPRESVKEGHESLIK
jgi:hypothetical protein